MGLIPGIKIPIVDDLVDEGKKIVEERVVAPVVSAVTGTSSSSGQTAVSAVSGVFGKKAWSIFEPLKPKNVIDAFQPKSILDSFNSIFVSPVTKGIDTLKEGIDAVADAVEPAVDFVMDNNIVSMITNPEDSVVVQAAEEMVNTVLDNEVVDFVAKNNIVSMILNPEDSVVVETVTDFVDGVVDPLKDAFDFVSKNNIVSMLMNPDESVIVQTLAKWKWWIIGGVGGALALAVLIKLLPALLARRALASKGKDAAKLLKSRAWEGYEAVDALLKEHAASASDFARDKINKVRDIYGVVEKDR